jgi:hypothetical protein
MRQQIFMWTRRAVLAALVAGLAGCVTNEFASSKPAEGATLKGGKVIVYSFLDVRQAELGPTMLDEFDKQLVAALDHATVPSKVVRFRNTDAGRYFTFGDAGMNVPVKNTIQGNADDEKSFGAGYRLVIFPSEMQIQGGWRSYDIRWEITDVHTGQVVWSTLSHGKHLVNWKIDENAAGRAQVLIDSFVTELKTAHLV